MKNKATLLMMIFSINTFASNGGGAQNGGKTATAQFEFAVEQIQRWVKRDHLKEIDTKGIPADVLAAQIMSLTQEILEHKVALTFSDKKQEITIDGKTEEYTCTNNTPLKTIDCNIDRWTNVETQQTRYFLVFHEMLGLLGYETNDGLASEYKISKQLLPYLGTELVLKDFAQDVYTGAEYATVVRCEGVINKRKSFILNIFPNGDTYVTDLRYSGNKAFAKVTRDLTYYQSYERDVPFEKKVGHIVLIDKRSHIVTFLNSRFTIATVEWGKKYIGDKYTLTIPCSPRSYTWSEDVQRLTEQATAVEKFRDYMKTLTQEDWVEMNSDLEQKDFLAGMSIPEGSVDQPRKFYYNQIDLD